MRSLLKIILISVVAGVTAAQASNLDTIGVTLLRATMTNLNGSGVVVGQPEAGDGVATKWEINPLAVGAATNLFTYISGDPPYLTVSSTNVYPNSLGAESGHGEFVADNFYGITNGVATNVAHVNNYEANTFVYYYVGLTPGTPHAISERIVNQSFTFGTNDTSVDQAYDNYAAQNNVLFVSGAGFNGQPVYSPATCYNGIGVGSIAFNSPDGPTPDGRSKPDIITTAAPETSYTTPQVAGAAAILMQAGLRGDGGGDTNSATDIRTLKALLLNGAVKEADWTNSPSQPFHFRYGAGVLNVFNSYEQLAGGKHGYIDSTSFSSGGPHPPTGATGTVPVLSGWDFTNCITFAHPATDAVNHYFFNVTNAVSNATFSATITLVWNRQAGQSSINNLNLFLYNCANSNLVMCSTSLVDNVEHVFARQLPQGRYDLQVLMTGGSGIISTSETYALAWNFSLQILNATKSGTNLNLSWLVYPAGFAVESTTNLTSPVWRTNGIPSPTVTNNQNVLLIPETNAVQFFRLRTPNF